MIIDTREPEKIKKEALKIFPEATLEALETGDFYEESIDLIVERKDISDFISSYKSSHLQKQLILMQKHKYPVLIISGKFSNMYWNKQNNHTNVNSYLGMLVALVLNNVKVIIVENDNQLLKTIELMIKRIKEGKMTEFTGETHFIEKTLSPYIKTLTLIPGISINLAERIQKQYSNLYQIINAIENDQFKIEGIGQKKKEEIKKFLEELIGEKI